MKKLILIVLLAATPAWGQTKVTAGRADSCAPIGRTAKGELVYSMKCESIPAPPAPPPVPEAEVKEAPAPQLETQRGGLFGWSYDRRGEQ